MSYKYVVDLIPEFVGGIKNRKRPKNFMDWEFITVHNTGNPKSTARNERAWLTNNQYNGNSSVSYHLVIDELEIIECVPLNENAWHAGDGVNGVGNRKSVGIEFCESGNYSKTMENGLHLITNLIYKKVKSSSKYNNMRAIDIVKSIVVQHNRWSKTECPRIIRSKGLWDKFLLDISVGLHDMLNPKKLIDEDLKNALDILVSYKQLQSPEYWLENAVEGSTVKGEFVNIILKRWSNMFKNVMDMENKKELDRVQVRKIVKY